MIRNRGDRRYRVASVVASTGVTAAVALVSWPLAVLFAWFTVRAAWLPSRSLTPKQVGLIELAHCLALLVAVPLLAT